VRTATIAYATYTYGVATKKIGPRTGMSASSGIRTAWTGGGLLNSVARDRIRRKMKLVMPMAPMLMTVPAMIWSTL
jgi:hypothetical protein